LKEPYQEIECDPATTINTGGPLGKAYPEARWPGCPYHGSHHALRPQARLTGEPSGPQALRLCSHDHKDNTTPCEAAANIIANMRGHNNTEAARAELGCVPGSSCVVENMAIFRALDG